MPVAPDRVDHLLAVAGIALLDPDDHIVMEHAFNGHVHVEDVGRDHLEQRQEYALRGLAEICVFLRRAADQRGRIDGVPPVRNGGNMEYRVLIRFGVVAGMVAEGSFDPPFVRIDETFKDELRLRRYANVDGLALDDLKRLLSEKARQRGTRRWPAGAARWRNI